jgi:asparagine synthase (glutamine-hydrolysing)
MCGIAAIFSSKGGLDLDPIMASIKTLEHRGPDARKVWVDDSGEVALGHARLSIIDLTTGDQPIKNEDGSIHIVANGEFYDHDRIRGELQEKGHRFRTRSDSEIALHLYEEYGSTCLEYLRGEFAFVIWDSRSRTLFAARDRFGIKPLYYAEFNERLYLASEAKALFAAGVPSEWNHQMIYETGDICVMSPGQSIFKGVRQVEPGQFLLKTDDVLETHRYWDFDYPCESALEVGTSETELIAGFAEVFEEAVKLRMRADVPVGCYLSGGLDSCAVLGFMARHASGPVQTYTLGFEEDAYDERAIASEMAELVGSNHHEVPVCQQDIADSFSDAIYHSETVFANGHGVSKFLLSRAVNRAGYKVVFTGEGSDEIHAGYPHFRQDMLRFDPDLRKRADVGLLERELGAANAVSKGLLIPDGEVNANSNLPQLLGFVPTWMSANASIGVKFAPLLRSEFLKRYAQVDGYRCLFNRLDVTRQLSGRHPVNQSMYLWSKTSLVNYILNVLGDRMEMAHSVEGRVPFLDHRVVEYMRGVPIGLKIKDMTEKYLLREAAKPWITETVYKRQKHPFLSPPATIEMEQPLFALIQDTLRSESAASLPFVDRDQVIKVLDRLPSMDIAERVSLDPVLMLLLSLSFLQQRFSL